MLAQANVQVIQGVFDRRLLCLPCEVLDNELDNIAIDIGKAPLQVPMRGVSNDSMGPFRVMAAASDQEIIELDCIYDSREMEEELLSDSDSDFDDDEMNQMA
mmetsp:Transcript_31607/g.39348  ORF Transcript_31607/g.39348 Transcript_31607/m.39348 type:complete len:102 (-) Transcript_31607:460-765(-)